MQEIPLLNVPNQELMVTLDGQDFVLTVKQRGERVYMDATLDGAPLFSGAVCLPGLSVGHAPYPMRGLFCWTDSLAKPMQQTAPNYKEFRSRYHLFYVPEDEILEQIALLER